MSAVEINLEGHRYLGKFKIEDKTYVEQVMVDSEVGRHPETRRCECYEGEGIIIDKFTKDSEQRFLIYPKGLNESHLIVLSEKVRQRVEDYKKVIDYALEIIYHEAERSDEIIPKIHQPVCIDDLVLKNSFNLK